MMNGAAKNAWYKDVATTAAGKTVDKIYWTYNGSTITYINYDSMFIYEGNVLPSTYEPYKGSEYTITLSEPLRSLSDGTKDYVDFNRGKVVRNVGRIITDGSSDENWIVDGTMGTVRYFCLSSLGSNLPVANLLSNRFKYNVKSYQEEITFSGGKYIEVGVLVSRLAADDLASFKLWLAANPVEILYKLKTPVEQDIVVPSIMATRGINTVYTTDVNQPPMEFDVDIKK
jgi:hypothetical protein